VERDPGNQYEERTSVQIIDFVHKVIPFSITILLLFCLSIFQIKYRTQNREEKQNVILEFGNTFTVEKFFLLKEHKNFNKN